MDICLYRSTKHFWKYINRKQGIKPEIFQRTFIGLLTKSYEREIATQLHSIYTLPYSFCETVSEDRSQKLHPFVRLFMLRFSFLTQNSRQIWIHLAGTQNDDLSHHKSNCFFSAKSVTHFHIYTCGFISHCLLLDSVQSLKRGHSNTTWPRSFSDNDSRTFSLVNCFWWPHDRSLSIQTVST